jgi:hypothetical protein
MNSLVGNFILTFVLLGGAFASAADSSTGTAKSRGNAFNPDISANTLFLYQNGNRGNNATATAPPGSSPNGASLQEAELQLTSDVDPYARAVVLLSVSQQAREWKIEPEEAFGESLQLPVTVRAGKFKAALGKYNTYHTHAYPFIDQNLINTVLLGDEGLNNAGISVAGLIPLPWFSEVTVQGLGADAEPFSNTSPNGVIGLVHLKNLWDLTDDLTMEWGLSGAQGPNDVDKQTQIWGSDLTFKWRPSVGGKYSALIWSTEYLNGQKTLDSAITTAKTKTQGGSSFVQWQFAQRWWLQGRDEYVEVLDPTAATADVRRKQSLLLAFLPTEFSGLRLQYDRVDDVAAISGYDKPESKIMLQLNLSIGAHPAHAY